MTFRNTLLVCASLIVTAPVVTTPLHAERIYAVDSRAVLVSFDSNRPSAVLTMAVVRGLQPGETILGIDFRPLNNKLYALGSSSRLYVIDPPTGMATPVGNSRFSPQLDGTKFGFNFNPVADRIRVTSNRGQNLRLNPDTGEAAVDGLLHYGDDVTPIVVASAYTNSTAGATSTTLYDFDIWRRAIVNQSPPNDGLLNLAFQVTGVDFSEVTGFDISPVGNKGYLATRETSAVRVQLLELDIPNGRARLSGTIGMLDQVSALAVEPPGGQAPLFTRLGGLPAITAVVDEFLSNIAADTRINAFFSAAVASATRFAALRQNLIDLVCAGSGGPCEYKGKDMKTQHQGMQIGDMEFDALIDDLVKALDRFKVPLEEKAALLGVLAPMRGDIVEKRQLDILGAAQ